MLNLFRPTIVLLALLTVLTGIVYPLTVTGAAQVAFSQQANGSVLLRSGDRVGSSLIGQPFDAPGYFWGRPSATSPFPYNAAASTASNLGPSNPALAEAVQTRIAALRAGAPLNQAPIPVDLVTTSASGLDPDLSPAAALYQVERVARARNLPVSRVKDLVLQQVEERTWGLLGEPRVNVLKLNLALDASPVPLD